MTEIRQSWKPTVCLYHRGCMDGFTAAWAVWTRWGDDVLYVPMGYGDDPPPVKADDDVLFVDFSAKRDDMAALSRCVRSVVVLDHHKTAEAELEQWRMPSVAAMTPEGVAITLAALDGLNVLAFFDMEKSGARLAWEFCHGTDIHPLVLRVEDRDLWRFDLDDTKFVHRYLCCQEQTFARWERIAEDYAQAVAFDYVPKAESVGRYLQADFDNNVKAMLANCHKKKIGGHVVPCVNVPYFMASDTAHQLLLRDPSAPFAAAYFVRGDGTVQYSLRSEDHRVDVSEIAKMYGGGGHRNAAGFSVPA